MKPRTIPTARPAHRKCVAAMILFNQFLSIILMVGLGLLFLWHSGIDIRAMRGAEAKTDDS